MRLDPKDTALLSLDCQSGIVSIYTKPEDGFLERTSSVLSAARAAGMRVIHVHVGFREGMPEIGDRNKLFAAVKSSPQHQALFLGPLAAIHPQLAPQPSEIVIAKHRISAFAGTGLDMILRANGIDTLVLFGIATSGVVLSTLLDAADKDYRTVVLTDCCADLDRDLHKILVDRFFPTRAEVLTSAEFASALHP